MNRFINKERDKRSEYNSDSSEQKQLQSRIFVDNVNVRRITFRDVSDWLANYAKVSDVSYQTHSILVQLTKEEDARKVITKLNNTIFAGNEVTIRMASANDGQLTHTRRVNSDNRSRSPKNREFVQGLPYERNINDMSPPTHRKSPLQNKSKDNYRHGRSLLDLQNAEKIQKDRFLQNCQLITKDKSQNFFDHESFDNNSNADLKNFNTKNLSTQLTEAPKVAILTMSPDILQYAEIVEESVRRATENIVPIQSNIIVIKSDKHIVHCLNDLADKQILYAVLLFPHHAHHQQCTLQLLQGCRKEYRDITKNDAMELMCRDYLSFLQNNSELLRNLKEANLQSLSIPKSHNEVEQNKSLSALNTTMNQNHDNNDEQNTKSVDVNNPAAFGSDPPIPSKDVVYFLEMLIQGKLLMLDELNEVQSFIFKRKNHLISQGYQEDPSGNNPNLPSGDNLFVGATSVGENEEQHRFNQHNLQNKILNIINPLKSENNPVCQPQTSNERELLDINKTTSTNFTSGVNGNSGVNFSGSRFTYPFQNANYNVESGLQLSNDVSVESNNSFSMSNSNLVSFQPPTQVYNRPMHAMAVNSSNRQVDNSDYTNFRTPPGSAVYQNSAGVAQFRPVNFNKSGRPLHTRFH